MTAPQRAMRAAPVLDAAGVTLAELRAELRRPDLPWNVNKARAYGVNVGTWLQAMELVDLQTDVSLGEFLEGLHRAESAVALLGAGYQPGRGPAGTLTWQRG